MQKNVYIFQMQGENLHGDFEMLGGAKARASARQEVGTSPPQVGKVNRGRASSRLTAFPFARSLLKERAP